MHIALLAAAAAAAFLPAAPAQAEITSLAARPAHSAHGVSIHRGFGSGHRNRHRPSRAGAVFAGWYDNEVGENRSWEPDSYNDWWHDRPDRAYPRWMTHNQDCERLWWSGGGWRC